MAEDLVKLGVAHVRTRGRSGAPAPEFADAVRRRRMTRAFDGRPVPPELVNSIVDLASRACKRRQDAGMASDRPRGCRDGALLGHHAAADAAWRIPLEATARRSGDRHPARRSTGLHGALLRARQAGDGARQRDGCLAGAVLDGGRLDVGDDVAAGCRVGRARCVVLRRVQGERQLRRALGIPGFMQVLGVIALGWPADTGSPGGEDETGPGGPGQSAARRRRRPEEIIHRGGWRVG